MVFMTELLGLFASVLATVTLVMPLFKKSTDVDKVWVNCGQTPQLPSVEGK